MPIQIEDKAEELNEVLFAEYLMLLFAVDAFAGHVEAKTQAQQANDTLTHKGIALLRRVDNRYGGVFKNHLVEKIPSETTRAMIERTYRIQLSTSEHVNRRALSLRTALNRNATATLKAVFDESRPRNAVKASIAASMNEEAGPALARFEALPVRNSLIKAWIRKAADAIGSGEIEIDHNPVDSASAAALDHVETLKKEKATEESTTGADEVKQMQDARGKTLQLVQDEATEAARAALEVSGKEDETPHAF